MVPNFRPPPVILFPLPQFSIGSFPLLLLLLPQMRMDSSSDSAMRIRLISLFACCLLLLQMIVIADWVDDVIEIVNQKMAPWHALLDKYDRALQTMESEERELTRIKQIIEKKIEMHQKKLRKLLLKVLGNTTFNNECKHR